MRRPSSPNTLAALEQELERIQRLNVKIEEESRRPEIAPAVARLRTLRGVDTVTAMTLVSELVDFSRFARPSELMAFAGLVPSEYSSGGRECRGRITKTGNAHVRRVLVEAAWHYRHTPTGTGISLRKRREGQPPDVLEIARRAELRLCRKYRKMTGKGKNSRLDSRVRGQGTGRLRVGDWKIPLIARDPRFQSFCTGPRPMARTGEPSA